MFHLRQRISKLKRAAAKTGDPPNDMLLFAQRSSTVEQPMTRSWMASFGMIGFVSQQTDKP